MEKLLIQTPFRFKAIFPDEACFIYFRSGKITLSAATRRVAIPHRDSILLQCGHYFADLLQEQPPGTIEVFAIHLYPDMLREIFKYDFPFSVPRDKGKAMAPGLRTPPAVSRFMEHLDFYFEHPEWMSKGMMQLKIKELLLLLAKTDKATSLSALFRRLFAPRQSRLEDIVEAHLFSGLSVPELATLSGLSLSSFKRTFRAIYGDTPAEFMRNRRLEEARKLLLHSDYSVSEIGYRTGFSDLSHFTKLFRKHTGLTPLAFRAEGRKPS